MQLNRSDEFATLSERVQVGVGLELDGRLRVSIAQTTPPRGSKRSVDGSSLTCQGAGGPSPA